MENFLLMNNKLTAVQIMQGPQGGTVRFTDLDKDGKPVKGSPNVIIQFGTAAEAGAYVQGRQYELTVKPVK